MHAGTTESVSALVDNGKVSGYQRLIIVLCGVIALLDGFDTQAIGFVAPVIADSWALSLATFGPIFAAGLLGGLIGAVLFGVIADRTGRRVTLLTTVTIFAVGSLLTVLADSPMDLAVYRFITGLGLGGAMPSIIALTSEYSPARLRTTLTTAMFCGFPLGAVLGAIVSSRLIEVHGWESVFIVGGILPLALIPVLAIAIPESLGWLAARGRVAQIEIILRKMKKELIATSPGADVTTGPMQSSPGYRSLFSQGRTLGSALLAVIFFASLLLVFLLVSWIPGIAVQSGHSVRAGVMAAAILNLAGIVGSLAIGRVSDRFGAPTIVGAAYWLGALGVMILAVMSQSSATIFVFCVIAGFFCIGAQMCAVAIASEFYPVSVRATGIGWAMGMGRFGAIAGPLVGSLLVAGEDAQAALLWIVAAFAAITGAAVFGMRSAQRLRTA